MLAMVGQSCILPGLFEHIYRLFKARGSFFPWNAKAVKIMIPCAPAYAEIEPSFLYSYGALALRKTG